MTRPNPMGQAGGGIDLTIMVQDHEAQRAIAALALATTPANYARFHYAFTSPYMRSKARDRFRTHGDAASGPWAPLRDATEEIRENAGFPGASPINVRTHELESFVTGKPGEVTITPIDAGFFFPNRPTSRAVKEKLQTAQMGKPGGTPLFGGRQGMGAPTPPRPVAAMDATDLIHTLAALEIFLTAEIGRHM